ncbi:MAG: transposase, partial [Bacteroidota bacterium]
MLGKQAPQRSVSQLVDLEDLVPQGHLVRRIDRAINLSFIRERVAPPYSEGWGRPSIDPKLALRMILLGYLFDLSDHKLCEEVRMHAGFRWFCRLEFQDPVPDRT